MLSALSSIGMSILPLPAAPAGGNTSTHYPEWRAKRRAKGKRDRSLRVRSNRRKAAMRAKHR